MKSKSCTLSGLILSLISFASVANDYPTFKFSGKIMLDYDRFDTNFLEAADKGDSNVELRRLRLKLESDISQDWRAKLNLEATDDGEIKDAYLKYVGWKRADFTLGKQKEPFGLERLMSSKKLSFIERSMISNAIAPGRAYGFKASGNQGMVSWHLGYFQNDNYEKGNAVTGKATWTPWIEDKNLVHVGVSFSERSLHGEAFRMNQNMEVHSADSLIEGAKFNADSASLTGIELLWQHNGFINMAEWQQSTVQADDGSEYGYEGGYYQMSYLFSGENRKYKNGMLSDIKTKDDWQVTLRYSQLALLAENNKAKIYYVGVNYYFDKDLKFMANYSNAEYVKEGLNLGSGDAMSIRAQYLF
ncbi:MAG: phosphate-selective porin OprO/OprP [Paraglaciecola sp.]|jgi:phosphate-selective porin OprO/OprP